MPCVVIWLELSYTSLLPVLQGVSNVAWAMATAGHRDDALFQQLLARCLSDISSYDVQGLSNLLWACATLGQSNATFLQAALQVLCCAVGVCKFTILHDC
eukprot:GHRQ01035860.1.p2 GENE.GHRQ01035860.1~~GHRQ01035860.1.p2  ORF type:complete len:100 (-),score=13.98 GHRQ01035860.1:368-667(-)